MTSPARVDPSAIGSDVARSRKQELARRLGALVVKLLRLNGGGFLSTEIVQQINPVCAIPTTVGTLRCRGGHGRLRWRAETFYSEEPETIRWLEGFGSTDIFWDVGANVGLYAIYAAKVARCKVVAFEPEAQNYALLLENIVLNGVQPYVEATNLAVTSALDIGRLHVHALTKGGAYNRFCVPGNGSTVGAEGLGAPGPVAQLQIGVSMDELVGTFGFPPPTQVKIDVDGNEPDIIAGGSRTLSDPRCRSVLIEVQRGDAEHARMIEQLQGYGFHCLVERSNWESRTDRTREREHPSTNMIFSKRSG